MCGERWVREKSRSQDVSQNNLAIVTQAVKKAGKRCLKHAASAHAAFEHHLVGKEARLGTFKPQGQLG